MQCSLYNDCFFFTLVIASQSISSQCFNYGKTAFFIIETLSWNRSNTFQWRITTTRHGSVFVLFFRLTGAIDVAENKSWVAVIKLSNKFCLFFQIWHQIYLYFWYHFTLIWNSKQVSELLKMLLQDFPDTLNWIWNMYLYQRTLKKSIGNPLDISIVSSAVIFPTTIEYSTSLSIDSNELFAWYFSHWTRGWLVGAGNAIGSLCNR